MKYSPVDHFGCIFFDEWDAEQWNLFYNFMMERIMIYLRSMKEQWYVIGRGVIP